MPDERADRLEERLAWLERHVTEQDKVMLEAFEKLSALERELSLLRLRSTAGPAEGPLPSPADERPPHY
jgi:SlyX protein